jgi:hypothetical protein
MAEGKAENLIRRWLSLWCETRFCVRCAIDSDRHNAKAARMGDKSPKANQKKTSQNQAKNSASQQKKGAAAAAKQAAKPKK